MQPPTNVQKWGALADERPEMAEEGSTMLVSHGLAYLGTVSRLGRPRVTPVSVVFEGDSLFVSLIRSTPKCRELETTPFFHLQALPGPRQEEFSVRGWARTVDDHQEISGLRKAHEASRVICGEDDVFFELLIDRVDLASFPEAPTGDLTPVREAWRSS